MDKTATHCMALVVGFAAPAGLLAQPVILEPVEITGSRIKRMDVETFSPVEVLKREEIVRTGRPTVAEVLRGLPANSGSYDESFSSSFAPGAAGISLRNFGQKTTLVLINGRRTASFGFAQQLQDTFVDLNSIPSAAVERIEILKDGASAIYGSDAVAGVVNVILRRDFTGIEATLAGGAFEGKRDRRFTLSGGIGDPVADKYNLFAVLDYYKRDYMSLADTALGATRDLRGFPGGRNLASLMRGGTWRQTDALGNGTENYRAITECPGRVMTGPEAVEAGLINLTPPPVQSDAAFATNNARAAATNTFCTLDTNAHTTGLPGTERLSLMMRSSHALSHASLAHLELAVGRIDTVQNDPGPNFAAATGLAVTAGGLRPFTYDIIFEPGVAGNPFQSRARYTGVLTGTGKSGAVVRSDTIRGSASATLKLGNWDLDSGLGYSLNDVTAHLNGLSLAGTSAVFSVPAAPQPPTPISASSSHDLDRWSTTINAVRGQLHVDFDRRSRSDLLYVDTKVSNSRAFKLPEGDVGLALGVEFRKERLKDEPPPLVASGAVLVGAFTATNGSRNGAALFGELTAPVFRSLDAQLAWRFDHYSDYGNSATPKAALKFRPVDAILVRASWSKGFRAPSLPEISPSEATFFAAVLDPEDNAFRGISGIFAGNPNLLPETSISRNLGVSFEPLRQFKLSIDLYQLDWRSVVTWRSFQQIINESCPNGPPCPSTEAVRRDPANNLVTAVVSNYHNLAQRKTNGIDLHARLELLTQLGLFAVGANVAYVNSFKEDGVEYAGSNAGRFSIPRVQAATTLDFDRGSLSLTGRVNYKHSYRQDFLKGTSFFTTQDPRFQTGVAPEHVASFTTVDMYARYAVSKHFTISGALINAFDKLPPYDPSYGRYDLGLHDLRGRQVRVAMSYKM